jgi:hypothetical protein
MRARATRMLALRLPSTTLVVMSRAVLGPPCLLLVLHCSSTSDVNPNPCDRNRAFGSLTPVGGINSPNDEIDARLSADELSVVFVSNRAAPAIYIASRIDLHAAFDPPTPILAAGQAGQSVFSPSLSADKLALYFVAQVDSLAPAYLYMSTRPTTGTEFGAPVMVQGLTDVGSAQVTPLGDAFYYSTYQPPAVTRGQFHAGRIDSTSPLDELGPPDGRNGPTVTQDELLAYFTRLSSIGHFEAWSARRATNGTKFGSVAPVTELNSDIANVRVSWISPDGCRLYAIAQCNGPNPVGDIHSDVCVAER